MSLSGDVESNPFPTTRYCKSVFFISPTNSVSLLRAILQESEAKLEMKIFDPPSIFV